MTTTLIHRPIGGTLSVKQADAARLLGVSDRTIRRWDRTGILPGHAVGGVRLYVRKDVERLAKKGKR